MPSPFPGMDPYLEGALWTTFHFAFGAEIVRQLAIRLRPRYLVLLVKRFSIETFDYRCQPEAALDDEASALADSLLRMAGQRQA